MDDQKLGLDFEIAEAAMRRAAEKAIHGTREERSGRFALNEGYPTTRGKTRSAAFRADRNREQPVVESFKTTQKK